MGIPVYFKTIIENNKQCICRPKIVDNLLFDLNCLIHPCCANETDEKVMFNNIYEKINDIIDLVKPKYIYIAVDGPCPMPKIKQQRQRRFQSAKQNKKWDTNAITPGTKFMNKLDNFLTKHFYWKPNIELSLSSIPGEGEQKIFHHIKNKSLNNTFVVFLLLYCVHQCIPGIIICMLCIVKIYIIFIHTIFDFILFISSSETIQSCVVPLLLMLLLLESNNSLKEGMLII